MGSAVTKQPNSAIERPPVFPSMAGATPVVKNSLLR